ECRQARRRREELRGRAPQVTTDLHARPSPGSVSGVPRLVSIAVLIIPIGVAFAGSSIVVLALPRLYGQPETPIVGVSWVITAYNAAVAVVALLLLPVVRRVPAAWLFAVGLVIFAGASCVCALANELSVLLVARCIQGAGAALLLAGSLPVLASL